MNLMEYKGPEGRTHTVRSPEDWAKRRAGILQNMALVMGPLPGPERRAPLEMEVRQSEKLPGLTRSKIAYTSFDYKGGDLTGWCQDRYMPRIRDVYGKDPARLPFDFPEVIAAIAPRPVFVHAPLSDSNFRVDSVRRCLQAARAVYDLLGAKDNLAAIYPEGGHGFPPEARKQAYAFLDRALGVDSGSNNHNAEQGVTHCE